MTDMRIFHVGGIQANVADQVDGNSLAVHPPLGTEISFVGFGDTPNVMVCEWHDQENNLQTGEFQISG